MGHPSHGTFPSDRDAFGADSGIVAARKHVGFPQYGTLTVDPISSMLHRVQAVERDLHDIHVDEKLDDVRGFLLESVERTPPQQQAT